MAEEWAELDAKRVVFLEDEGPRIGSVCLPGPFYARLRAGAELIVLWLDVPFALRAARSLATYGDFGPVALAEPVAQFRARMGSGPTQSLLDLLERGNLRAVCEEALRNYDRHYERHLAKSRDTSRIVTVAINSLDASAAAKQVLEAVASNYR